MSIFKKPRIVFMGTPRFAVASLEALLGMKDYKIVAVVTIPDKPAGRGKSLKPSPVKECALANGLPVLQPEKLKDPEFLESLKALKPDIFVVVGFRMLPEEVWKMPPLGTFNLHAALLPQYRGAAPLNWVLINGERHTGVTTFLIDNKIDTGKIMMRVSERIDPNETVADLHDRLMALGAETVLHTVTGMIEKNIEVRLQRSYIQGTELLHPAPKITRELQHIDWTDSAAQIHNLVRGLCPYPTGGDIPSLEDKSAFTELVRSDGTGDPIGLHIYGCRVSSYDSFHIDPTEATPPGTILTEGRKRLGIAAADGVVELLQVQLSGKKRMDAVAFRNGFRDLESYTTTKGTSKAAIAAAAPVEGY